MKIALPFEQFFDDQGRPLVAGRVTVYKHDSDIPADLFTLEGDIYASAENPFRTDNDGRIPTVWFEAAVVDVKVERLLDDHVNFELVDTFQAGFDYPRAGNSSVVYSMSELKNTDPEVGIVQVVGYNNDHDCPPRFFIWDEHCEDNPDGGVIVESDLGDEGRWILLYDDELLPCSFYGIVPGEEEANIGAFLNYPDRIGTYKIRTPLMPRFLGGTYSSDTVFQTSRSIYFDRGARFPSAQIVCRSAVIPENDNYIADFIFTDSKAVAHSSWFKTLVLFYTCGADTLYLDSTNYFVNSVIQSAVSLANKTLIGSNRLQPTYQNHGYVQVSDRTICERLFSPAQDYVRISGQGHGDDIFITTGNWDPGLISEGHHIQFEQAPDLDMFGNANWWVSTMLERRSRLTSVVWSDYTLDLQGRTASSLYLPDTSFTTVRNGRFTGTVICAGTYITFENVTANVSVNSSTANGLYLTATDSHLSIQRYHHGLTTLNATDSYISVIGAEGLDPCDTAISVYGGSFSGIIKMSTDHCNAYLLNKQVTFQNVRILDGFSWRLNYLQMIGCYSSGKIDLYPAAGGDGKFYYNLLMSDNKFVGNFRLWITYYYDADHPHFEVRGTAVKFNMMKIVNNRFDTVDAHAIKMTMWHIGFLEPYMYATYADQNMGTWEYQGNSGNCPGMAPPRIDNYGNWTHHYEQPLGPHHYYRSNDTYYLFMPWHYEPGGASSNSSPNSMLDPACPTSRVTALIQESNTDGDWADCDVWYANGLSTPGNLENEDYNNRFLVYVWLTKPAWSTDTANYNHNGYTTFVRSGS